MKAYIGTSGFTVQEWKRKFYPEKLSSKEMLSFYSQKLNTVEINNTFYHMPRKSVAAAWSDQVRSDFIFAFKAPQIITHIKRMRNVAEEIGYLFRILKILDKKLGPILFQYPKSFRPHKESLKEFLPLLPDGVLCAFEFRNKSWLDDEVLGLLRKKGCSVCIADTKIRHSRSSQRRIGDICACGERIIQTMLFCNGKKRFWRKNGMMCLFILNTKMKQVGRGLPCNCKSCLMLM